MISVKNSFEIAYNGTENACRFELYADTASDLQGLTHIDGIKIQMGSECTDIATGDKYILNGSGAWILQPKDNAFTNVYTKAEIDNMSNVIYQTMLYYHTAHASSDGSITFYTLGTPVSSLTIYGNGQQNGTPTPDNPVMPEFVGVRTGNLYFKKIASANISDSGVITALAGFDLYIAKVEQGVRYSGNGYTYAFFEDEPVLGSVSYNGSRVVNSLSNIASPINGFVAARVNSTSQNNMCNTGSSVLPYEPYGLAEKITCAGQTVPVYLGQTQTVRRIKKYALTGNENAQIYSDAGLLGFELNISDMMTNSRTLGVCTHFRTQMTGSGMTTDGITFGANNKTVYVTFSRNTIDTFALSDITSIHSWLSAQYAAGTPVTVWYVLEAEQTGIVNEPLAKIGTYADEMHITNADVSIPTVSGENTLTVDTDLIPSKIVISGGE